MTTERLLHLKEVEDIIGFKRSWIYKRVRKREFPSPINVHSRNRWSQQEVQMWISEQKKRRKYKHPLARLFFN
jgi:prophage regulatory protein